MVDSRAKCYSWRFFRGVLTGNGALRAHWRERQRERDAWRLLVLSVCGRGQVAVSERAEVSITLRPRRRQDPDNAYASVKPILDSLVHWGWLYDDCEAFLELQVSQAQRIDGVESVDVSLRYPGRVGP